MPSATLRTGSPRSIWRFEASTNRWYVDSSRRICQPADVLATVVVVQAALGHLLRVLRADGRIPARHVGRSRVMHDELECFTSYLEQVCRLAAKTRAGRRWWVEQFLADRFGRGPLAIDRLTPGDIVDFLGRHGTHYTRGHRRRPRRRSPQLSAFPRRLVRRWRGRLDRGAPHGRVLALGGVADRAHAG